MKPRLLLVEDDPTIQQLVAMALEELALELKICSGVAEALELLRRAPVQMLITDLMLPDGTGLDLIKALVANPALRGDAPLVVFSAGLRAELREQLAGLGVWRMLNKPCSVLELEACVMEGLGLAQVQAPGGAGRAAPDTDNTADTALPAPQAAALAAHFGGDLPLYVAFRESCLPQFALDRQQGDQACDSRDAAGLRRLAHSLKSVLLTLGHEAESLVARQLEDSAERGDWAASLPLWQELRARLPQAA